MQFYGFFCSMFFCWLLGEGEIYCYKIGPFILQLFKQKAANGVPNVNSYPLGNDGIFPTYEGTFEGDYPFSKVGCVSSLMGNWFHGNLRGPPQGHPRQEIRP